ncbi:MAG TPA: serine--tRNA ligase [Aggregatilineales bacterium]|nr:serine--tRNA ligase [Aggregatilineales bacterium]
MIDIALIREKPDWVKEQIARLQDEPAIKRVDTILALDQKRRALLTQSETLQAERNKLNKAVGRLRGDKSLGPSRKGQAADLAIEAIQAEDYAKALDVLNNPPAEGKAYTEEEAKAALDRLSNALRAMGEGKDGLDKQIAQIEPELHENMLWIPNLPHPSVKFGASDAENTIYPHHGELRQFDFTPKPHWELGPELDIIDFDRGVKLSGTRFYVLKGMGARLQRALINFYLDMHTQQHGFTEFYTPFLVKPEMMYGAAQFPKFKDVVYQDTDAELCLLPTAEVSLTNLHRDEILEADQLPLYYVANTPCWRREQTSAGRDVRGIKRVHQFQKVEMYKLTTPETSYAELESLVEAASDVCRALKIPFRRVEQVTGDLGFAAAKKYDLEMWAPGCQEWLEVSSCSNCEAFQARRAQIRYRPAPGAKAEYVHTLNGSGLALPRTIIAILENYQQADGSVVVPNAIRPYMGGLEVIRRKA